MWLHWYIIINFKSKLLILATFFVLLLRDTFRKDEDYIIYILFVLYLLYFLLSPSDYRD